MSGTRLKDKEKLEKGWDNRLNISPVSLSSNQHHYGYTQQETVKSSFDSELVQSETVKDDARLGRGKLEVNSTPKLQTAYTSISTTLGFKHHEGTDESKELDVVRYVLARESILLKLQNLCGKISQCDVLVQSSMILESELLDTLALMRATTVNFIEILCVWRESADNYNAQNPRIFEWEGQNYTLKTINDLDFLAAQPLLVESLKLAAEKMKSNPLMLSNTVEEVDTSTDPAERAALDCGGLKSGDFFDERLRVRKAERVLLFEKEMNAQLSDTADKDFLLQEMRKSSQFPDSVQLTEKEKNDISTLSSKLETILQGNGKATKSEVATSSATPLNYVNKHQLSTSFPSSPRQAPKPEFARPDTSEGVNRESDPLWTDRSTPVREEKPLGLSLQAVGKPKPNSVLIARKASDDEIKSSMTGSLNIGKHAGGIAVKEPGEGAEYHSAALDFLTLDYEDDSKGSITARSDISYLGASPAPHGGIFGSGGIVTITAYDLEQIARIENPPARLVLAAATVVVLLWNPRGTGEQIPPDVSYSFFLNLTTLSSKMAAVMNAADPTTVSKIKLKALLPYMSRLNVKDSFPGSQLSPYEVQLANKICKWCFQISMSASSNSQQSFPAGGASGSLVKLEKDKVTGAVYQTLSYGGGMGAARPLSNLSQGDKRLQKHPSSAGMRLGQGQESPPSPSWSPFNTRGLASNQAPKGATSEQPAQVAPMNSSLLLNPLRPGPLQKAGLLPKLSRRSENFKKEIRLTSAHAKIPKAKRADISIENRLLSVDILRQRNARQIRREKLAEEKLERENAIELFAVHTEIVEGLKPHTYCLTLLSSIKRNDSVSDTGFGLWELCTQDRLLVKVYDLVSSQEATCYISIKEYSEFSNQLSHRYPADKVADVFKPLSIAFWAKSLRNVVHIRAGRGLEKLSVTVDKNAMMMLVQEKVSELKELDRRVKLAKIPQPVCVPLPCRSSSYDSGDGYGAIEDVLKRDMVTSRSRASGSLDPLGPMTGRTITTLNTLTTDDPKEDSRPSQESFVEHRVELQNDIKTPDAPQSVASDKGDADSRASSPKSVSRLLSADQSSRRASAKPDSQPVQPPAVSNAFLTYVEEADVPETEEPQGKGEGEGKEETLDTTTAESLGAKGKEEEEEEEAEIEAEAEDYENDEEFYTEDEHNDDEADEPSPEAAAVPAEPETQTETGDQAELVEASDVSHLSQAATETSNDISVSYNEDHNDTVAQGDIIYDQPLLGDFDEQEQVEEAEPRVDRVDTVDLTEAGSDAADAVSYGDNGDAVQGSMELSESKFFSIEALANLYEEKSDATSPEGPPGNKEIEADLSMAESGDPLFGGAELNFSDANMPAGATSKGEEVAELQAQDSEKVDPIPTSTPPNEEEQAAVGLNEEFYDDYGDEEFIEAAEGEEEEGEVEAADPEAEADIELRAPDGTAQEDKEEEEGDNKDSEEADLAPANAPEAEAEAEGTLESEEAEEEAADDADVAPIASSRPVEGAQDDDYDEGDEQEGDGEEEVEAGGDTSPMIPTEDAAETSDADCGDDVRHRIDVEELNRVEVAGEVEAAALSVKPIESPSPVAAVAPVDAAYETEEWDKGQEQDIIAQEEQETQQEIEVEHVDEVEAEPQPEALAEARNDPTDEEEEEAELVIESAIDSIEIETDIAAVPLESPDADYDEEARVDTLAGHSQPCSPMTTAHDDITGAKEKEVEEVEGAVLAPVVSDVDPHDDREDGLEQDTEKAEEETEAEEQSLQAAANLSEPSSPVQIPAFMEAEAEEVKNADYPPAGCNEDVQSASHKSVEAEALLAVTIDQNEEEQEEDESVQRDEVPAEVDTDVGHEAALRPVETESEALGAEPVEAHAELAAASVEIHAPVPAVEESQCYDIPDTDEQVEVEREQDSEIEAETDVGAPAPADEDAQNAKYEEAEETGHNDGSLEESGLDAEDEKVVSPFPMDAPAVAAEEVGSDAIVVGEEGDQEQVEVAVVPPVDGSNVDLVDSSEPAAALEPDDNDDDDVRTGVNGDTELEQKLEPADDAAVEQKLEPADDATVDPFDASGAAEQEAEASLALEFEGPDIDLEVEAAVMDTDQSPIAPSEETQGDVDKGEPAVDETEEAAYVVVPTPVEPEPEHSAVDKDVREHHDRRGDDELAVEVAASSVGPVAVSAVSPDGFKIERQDTTYNREDEQDDEEADQEDVGSAGDKSVSPFRYTADVPLVAAEEAQDQDAPADEEVEMEAAAADPLEAKADAPADEEVEMEAAAADPLEAKADAPADEEVKMEAAAADPLEAKADAPADEEVKMEAAAADPLEAKADAPADEEVKMEAAAADPLEAKADAPADEEVKMEAAAADPLEAKADAPADEEVEMEAAAADPLEAKADAPADEEVEMEAAAADPLEAKADAPADEEVEMETAAADPLEAKVEVPVVPQEEAQVSLDSNEVEGGDIAVDAEVSDVASGVPYQVASEAATIADFEDTEEAEVKPPHDVVEAGAEEHSELDEEADIVTSVKAEALDSECDKDESGKDALDVEDINDAASSLTKVEVADNNGEVVDADVAISPAAIEMPVVVDAVEGINTGDEEFEDEAPVVAADEAPVADLPVGDDQAESQDQPEAPLLSVDTSNFADTHAAPESTGDESLHEFGASVDEGDAAFFAAMAATNAASPDRVEAAKEDTDGEGDLGELEPEQEQQDELITEAAAYLTEMPAASALEEGEGEAVSGPAAPISPIEPLDLAQEPEPEVLLGAQEEEQEVEAAVESPVAAVEPLSRVNVPVPTETPSPQNAYNEEQKDGELEEPVAVPAEIEAEARMSIESENDDLEVGQLQDKEEVGQEIRAEAEVSAATELPVVPIEAETLLAVQAEAEAEAVPHNDAGKDAEVAAPASAPIETETHALADEEAKVEVEAVADTAADATDSTIEETAEAEAEAEAEASDNSAEPPSSITAEPLAAVTQQVEEHQVPGQVDTGPLLEPTSPLKDEMKKEPEPKAEEVSAPTLGEVLSPEAPHSEGVESDRREQLANDVVAETAVAASLNNVEVPVPVLAPGESPVLSPTAAHVSDLHDVSDVGTVDAEVTRLQSTSGSARMSRAVFESDKTQPYTNASRDEKVSVHTELSGLTETVLNAALESHNNYDEGEDADLLLRSQHTGRLTETNTDQNTLEHDAETETEVETKPQWDGIERLQSRTVSETPTEPEREREVERNEVAEEQGEGDEQGGRDPGSRPHNNQNDSEDARRESDVGGVDEGAEEDTEHP